MKTNAIVRIILFSIAILLLLGILLTGMLFGIYMSNSRVETSDTIENLPVVTDGVTTQGAVSAEEIRNVEIEWVAGSITIQPVENTDQITISESGYDNEKYRMVYKQNGNTLKLQYCEDSISFPSFGISINGSISKDLVISVPAGWVCDTLEIDAAAANVDIRNLKISELDFDGASGACSFTNCTVGEISMDTASGDVEFSGTLDVLDFDGASANCSILVLNVPDRIDIDTASGDLELYLPDECGFSCTLNAMSGHFFSDFETTGHNGHHVHGDGGCVINVDAMSGDVFIRRHGSTAASVTTPAETIPAWADSNYNGGSQDHSGNHTKTPEPPAFSAGGS